MISKFIILISNNSIKVQHILWTLLYFLYYSYDENTPNDIIGLLDNELQQIVSYTYTSWGEIASVKDSSGNEITDTNHIWLINPYRYRSYRYDSETGIDYLYPLANKGEI